jgi:hypothetical protein
LFHLTPTVELIDISSIFFGTVNRKI